MTSRRSLRTCVASRMPVAAVSASLFLLVVFACLSPVVLSSTCDYEEIVDQRHHGKSVSLRGTPRGGDDADVAAGLGTCEECRWDLKKLSLKVRRYDEQRFLSSLSSSLSLLVFL